MLETLAELAGVNILFDESFRDKRVAVDLEGVSSVRPVRRWGFAGDVLSSPASHRLSRPLSWLGFGPIGLGRYRPHLLGNIDQFLEALTPFPRSRASCRTAHVCAHYVKYAPGESFLDDVHHPDVAEVVVPPEVEIRAVRGRCGGLEPPSSSREVGQLVHVQRRANWPSALLKLTRAQLRFQLLELVPDIENVLGPARQILDETTLHDLR